MKASLQSIYYCWTVFFGYYFCLMLDWINVGHGFIRKLLNFICPSTTGVIPQLAYICFVLEAMPVLESQLEGEKENFQCSSISRGPSKSFSVWLAVYNFIAAYRHQTCPFHDSRCHIIASSDPINTKLHQRRTQPRPPQQHHSFRNGDIFFSFPGWIFDWRSKKSFKINTISSNSGFWMILDPLGAPEYTSVVFDIFWIW